MQHQRYEEINIVNLVAKLGYKMGKILVGKPVPWKIGCSGLFLS
jgi:hypothetical protein